MNVKTILVVDDEKDIVNAIKINLKNAGFNVLTAEDGKVAIDILEKISVHLIVIDLIMPLLDGERILREIKKRSGNVSIILLIKQGEYFDKTQALNIGANDYIMKPFTQEELMQKIKSFLKKEEVKLSKEENSHIIEIENLVIDLKKRIITMDNKYIKVTPIEFSILELLVKNHGKVLSVTSIYESVWNQKYFASDNTVMVHIRRLRGKIEREPNNPKIIKTVWGVGYKVDI
ncbi:MAG: response regulator transcription factor [Oscillospiraceae bacterium]|nr:response regulator transcription factor [Oscillospiraceae bacterium]